MRTNDVLIQGFGEIQTLFQYLYMNEEHYVLASNGVCTMRIRMDDELRLKCVNMNYPNVPESARELQLEEMLAVVDQLKHQPAVHPTRFENMWEEVKTITSLTLSMNKVKYSAARLRESNVHMEFTKVIGG